MLYINLCKSYRPIKCGVHFYQWYSTIWHSLPYMVTRQHRSDLTELKTVYCHWQSPSGSVEVTTDVVLMISLPMIMLCQLRKNWCFFFGDKHVLPLSLPLGNKHTSTSFLTSNFLGPQVPLQLTSLPKITYSTVRYSSVLNVVLVNYNFTKYFWYGLLKLINFLC